MEACYFTCKDKGVEYYWDGVDTVYWFDSENGLDSVGYTPDKFYKAFTRLAWVRIIPTDVKLVEYVSTTRAHEKLQQDVIKSYEHCNTPSTESVGFKLYDGSYSSEYKVGDIFEVVSRKSGAGSTVRSGCIVQLHEDDGTNNPVFLLCGVQQPTHEICDWSCLMATTGTLTTGKPDTHSHYFKHCPYDYVDVYRVIELFSVTDPCLQHALKKLLVAGGRGHKDIARDVQDVIDSCERWKQMREEENE